MTEWFVSTTGASGNAGTIGSPWDLASAVTGHSGSIVPGDGVWLRSGTYAHVDTGKAFTLNGTLANPIIFRAYNPSCASISATNGDPSQAERVIFQQQQTSAAASAGAITVNGINGAGSATVSIAKATNAQAVLIGHQLTIASGPAAGVYVITANTTLIVGNTSVSITPNLRGATAGGEVVTLTLTPSNVDFLQCPGNFIRLWGIEIKGIFSLRSINVGGAAVTSFGSVTDGFKLINCIIHDFIGPGWLPERTSGDAEAYGNLVYNQGGALADGGGHGFYIHHLDATKDLRIEANCFFNDHGIAVQLYDGGGSNMSRVRVVNNISMNSGQLNNAANIGGIDATVWVIGNGQNGTLSEIDVDGNHAIQVDGVGDRVFDMTAGADKIVGPVRIRNNVSRSSGSGYGALKCGSIGVGGSLTHTGNKYRIYRSDASRNGRAYNLAEAGNVAKPGQYTWSGNTIYRNLGAGGNACGDETGGGVPFLASVGGVGGCRTITQFLTDCSFTLDVRTADPIVTEVYVIPRTKYEDGSCWVVYYNYGNLANIPVDLSSILAVNDIYVIHDVRDIWAGMSGQGGTPVVGPATYTGALVNVPNTQVADPAVTGAQPGIGNEVNPPATAPVFNTFLVRKTGHAPTPPQGANSLKRNPGSFQSVSSSGSSGF